MQDAIQPVPPGAPLAIGTPLASLSWLPRSRARGLELALHLWLQGWYIWAWYAARCQGAITASGNQTPSSFQAGGYRNRKVPRPVEGRRAQLQGASRITRDLAPCLP
ncbi:hypothetical protein B2J93_8703 [Marssonina coronariae]|uniref:Uncharacterized protein n=1 Tax=Diplocarpon coronariae TaxID=2795749 RepID=A0A218YXD6_9HELO|nr:hypothetical protein B2J93_8703 [Marssonina coronariae]